MRSNRNHRKALTALVLGLATAAVFTASASAGRVFENGSRVPDGYVGAGVVDEAAPSSGYVGRVFVNGSRVPDGYVGAGVAEENLSGAGVTPTNLDRASATGTKVIHAAAVSDGSGGFDRGDLALGFGLGLILATACAIAWAMVRDRDHTQMAHS
jgi:hypothetical protein